MKTMFENKRIAGILGILPETAYYYVDEVIDGDSVRHQRIRKNMGYDRRYRAKPTTTTAMLCNAGMKYLLDQQIVRKEEIGAVLVISFTPDYYVPQISNLIQMENNLPIDILTVDFWAGCAGFIEGLQQAFMLLDSMGEKKILLFTGDVFCRKKNVIEKYNVPVYGGDGASVTILENGSLAEKIPFSMKICGEQRDLIAFKQGAFDDLFHQKIMGNSHQTTEAFRFFQKVVPSMLQELLEYANVNMEDIDMFDFIQANKLSARKFADALNIPYEKVPMDLVAKYGDSSSTLNPIGIIDYYGDKLLKKNNHKVLICGYGAGLRWGATIINLGDLRCCKNIITDL